MSRRTPERIYDEFLVMHANRGDPAAFARLAARWQPRLLAYAGRMTRHREAAREAVQDAWVDITRGLGRLSDPAAFPAWAYRILTRRCADLARDGARADAAAHSAAADAELNGQAVDAAADQGLDLRDAMAALPADQRAAVALHYLEDMGVNDIAAVLDVPPGTVKSRLFHARKALKRALQGDPS